MNATKKVGCIGLGGCVSALVGVLVIGGFLAGILFLVFGALKSSPVYTRALQAAQSDVRVTQALGDPVQPGWYVMGSTEEQGLSGDATLTIPLAGSRKNGTLYASARKQNGVWVFYTLAVQVDGDDKIIPLIPPR